VLLFVVCPLAAYFRVSGEAKHGSYWDKYQQVQIGMTQPQVEAILGPPESEDHFGGGFAGHWSYWQENQRVSPPFSEHVHVYFSLDGTVVYKEFRAPTWWSKAREWWSPAEVPSVPEMQDQVGDPREGG
jgi:hypothetical protein